MIYLDANATEPLMPAARDAALAAMALTGNPSSVHQAGREARKVLEDARRTIAEVVGGDADGLVFTSGGTEANALAISGLRSGRRVLCGATEHAAVLEADPGGTRIPVDGNGVVDLQALETMLGQGSALVCVMLANNETGVVAPIVEIAAICRRAWRAAACRCGASGGPHACRSQGAWCRQHGGIWAQDRRP